MIFKYRKKIFDAIIDTLIENERGLTYSDLYEQVRDKLDSHLSHRDYWEHHLLNMKKEGLVLKKGNLYILSDAAKNSRLLGILGVDENDNNNIERLRCLYQFLILFDCFYHEAEPIVFVVVLGNCSMLETISLIHHQEFEFKEKSEKS